MLAIAVFGQHSGTSGRSAHLGAAGHDANRSGVPSNSRLQSIAESRSYRPTNSRSQLDAEGINFHPMDYEGEGREKAYRLTAVARSVAQRGDDKSSRVMPPCCSRTATRDYC